MPTGHLHLYIIYSRKRLGTDREMFNALWYKFFNLWLLEQMDAYGKNEGHNQGLLYNELLWFLIPKSFV